MRLGALVLLTLLAGADCGTETCPGLPLPMTQGRAKALDPSVTTGLAISTTHVFGDCRPLDDPLAVPTACDGTASPCARERQSMRVLLLPVNQSIVVSPRCDPALSVEDLEDAAVLDDYSSEAGELVATVASGRYSLFISTDDRCAVCGLPGEAGACIVEIAEGEITTRDLFLDRSTR